MNKSLHSFPSSTIKRKGEEGFFYDSKSSKNSFFSDAATHLYKKVCPSIRSSVVSKPSKVAIVCDQNPFDGRPPLDASYGPSTLFHVYLIREIFEVHNSVKLLKCKIASLREWPPIAASIGLAQCSSKTL